MLPETKSYLTDVLTEIINRTEIMTRATAGRVKLSLKLLLLTARLNLWLVRRKST